MKDYNVLLTIATINVIYKTEEINDKSDIIKPFVLSILSKNYKKGQIIGLKKITEELNILYGLKNVPEAVVSRILSNVSKKGKQKVSKVKNNTYTYESIDNEDLMLLESKKTEAYESVQKLTKSIIKFFKKEKEEIDSEKALDIFFTYMQKNGFEYLINGEYIPLNGDKNFYIISKYIYENVSKKTDITPHIIKVFNGMILANSIYYSNNFETNCNFLKDLSVYIDTALLLNLLELKSDEENAFSKPIIDLLPNNVKLKCFEHNLEEVKSIIENYKRNRYQNILTLEKFDLENYDNFRIDLYVQNLEKEIENLNIEIDTTSSFGELTNNYKNLKGTIDQDKLESLLKERIPSYISKPQMLKADVDSMIYISLLRGGKKIKNISDCKAIFVTSNHKLVEVARIFFKPQKENCIDLVVDDLEFITAMWVNNTQSSDELTKEMMVSLAYATMSKIPQNFLTSVKIQLDNLKEDKKITEENYNALLYNYQFQKTLVAETNADSKQLDSRIMEGIEKYKEDIITKAYPKLIDENKKINAENEKYKFKLENEKKRQNEKKHELLSKAEQKAKQKGQRMLILLLFIYLIIIIILQLPGLYKIFNKDEPNKGVWCAVNFILILLSILDFIIHRLQFVLKSIKKITNMYETKIINKKIKEINKMFE